MGDVQMANRPFYRYSVSKAERFKIREHLRFANFLSLGKHVETSVTVVFE